MEITITIERDDQDVEVNVSGTYNPGYQGSRLDPPLPEDIYNFKCNVVLSTEEEEFVIAKMLERIKNDIEIAREQSYELRYYENMYY
jgi:hypothetical protein